MTAYAFDAKPGGYGTRQTLTRCSDTNAYTAGDVIGIGTGGGNTTPGNAVWTFPLGPAAGGEVIIDSCALEVDVAAVPSGMTTFTLHLYNVTPPSALVDNAAWDLPAGDRTAYLGSIDLGAPVDVGSTLWVQQDGLNKQITLLGANVYGYLQTVGGYTPSSASVKAILLHAVRP